MRIVALAVAVLLVGCANIPTFVRPSLPGRPCAEECLVGELTCVYKTRDSAGFFLLGPFMIAGEPATRGLRACELAGKICASQCANP